MGLWGKRVQALLDLEALPQKGAVSEGRKLGP